MEKAGFVFSGLSPDGRFVEIIELKDHPWFVATQFHPEFTSRPTRPQPLFRDFIEAEQYDESKVRGSRVPYCSWLPTLAGRLAVPVLDGWRFGLALGLGRGARAPSFRRRGLRHQPAGDETLPGRPEVGRQPAIRQ